MPSPCTILILSLAPFFVIQTPFFSLQCYSKHTFLFRNANETDPSRGVFLHLPLYFLSGRIRNELFFILFSALTYRLIRKGSGQKQSFDESKWIEREKGLPSQRDLEWIIFFYIFCSHLSLYSRRIGTKASPTRIQLHPYSYRIDINGKEILPIK